MNIKSRLRIKMVVGLFLAPLVVGLLLWWTTYFKQAPEVEHHESVSGQHLPVPIMHWVLKNGAKVYQLQTTQLPMVDIRLTFNAGSAHDGDVPGLAKITNRLLLEGSLELSSDEIGSKLDDLGVQYSVGSYRDMAVVEARMLSDKEIVNQVVPLLAKIVGQPAFEPEAIVRVLKQQKQLLAHQQQKPLTTAYQLLYKQLYQQGAYGTWPDGTIESLEMITADKVKAYHQQYYVNENVSVTMVGDLTEDQALALSEELTQYLSDGEAPLPLDEPKAVVFENQAVEYESSQSQILLANLSVTRQDGDYPALMVANTMLGAVPASLLFDTVRDKMGLAYNINSYIQPMQIAGPIIIQSQTRKSERETAIQATQKIILDLIQNGPTDEQLKVTKQRLKGQFLVGMQSNGALLEHISLIGFYQLPLTYFDDYLAAIEQVTAVDVQDVLSRYLHPDNLVQIVVGT